MLRTNINKLPAERFTNCSVNVQFVYSPTINYLTVYYTIGTPCQHMQPGNTPCRSSFSKHFTKMKPSG
ncbi:hypothetical protein HanXRQr2_Chr16g0773921 [Helianthus annuus]|uniref:Uncharacterized protein n=1 Tax=Helianthus annuus TaxID=4232 RepID=A0A9K3DVL1_HELAN|nr:hypothetical protein HanXRQr2_Chr16g0773921 [Helianthus annuus]